ncbi:lysylphosphatidylglycerol synthase transmembrane domain-containing protein [Halorientalis salina]|uniref:lysylphosphatidylglycerol synthase transmembrane domain-containing protein n=1 Tax=Halorientalis salina TaxID=2932266 RepID=UPI0010ACBF02|nr:lysylphosphatidylglycerol synthase transmembrane domain-containing protein [Halorientalis salina]
MNGDRRATVAGFAGAVLVLLVLFWFVGIDEILAALSGANRVIVAALVPVAVLWLCAWGMALYTVLQAIDNPVSAPMAVLLYTAAMFANNVTPFGQAGGEPITALLISQAADSEYESGLAAIASVDALHFVPSVVLATSGLAFFAVETVTLGRNLQIAAVAVGGLAVAIPVAVYLGWRYRYELEAAVVRLLTPVIRALGRLVPRLSPPDPDVIEHRIEGFFVAIDRVASSRRRLALALGFSLAGWLALTSSLWLSVVALGYDIPFAAVLVVIPVGAIASGTPLPGGLGGIETAFVVLLVSTTGIPAAAAGAAVVIHRVATYWLPTLAGAGVAAAFGARREQPPTGGE